MTQMDADEDRKRWRNAAVEFLQVHPESANRPLAEKLAMKRPANGALASIIIPCWNQLEFTRLCLAALVRQTRRPWELIVVDNGSTDGTGNYLAGVQDVAPDAGHGRQQRAEHRLPGCDQPGAEGGAGGLPGACSITMPWSLRDGSISSSRWRRWRGMEPRRTRNGEERGNGEKICVGLAGPMSNYASPPQLVENVPYQNLEEMAMFARRWRAEHRGQWFTTGKLSGFCLLMKRAVYEAIGGLDEQFGLGLFDDDDLAEQRTPGRLRAGRGP